MHCEVLPVLVTGNATDETGLEIAIDLRIFEMSNQDQGQRGKNYKQGNLSSQDPAEGRPDVPQESNQNSSTRHQERKHNTDKAKRDEQNRTSTNEPAEGRPDAD